MDRSEPPGRVGKRAYRFSGLYLMRCGRSASSPRRRFQIGMIVLEIAFEPDRLAVAFERQDVGGDAVEEPAIVADHHGAMIMIRRAVASGRMP